LNNQQACQYAERPVKNAFFILSLGMESKKSYIPIKVFISYLAIAALVVAAGYILYKESTLFSETENKIAAENTKVLKVGSLISDVYQTEHLSRVTIQSEDPQDFKNYLNQIDTLSKEIDVLKSSIKSQYQLTLLDSVKYLLSKKTANILELKQIKSQASEELAVKKAISNVSQMQESFRNTVRLQDFIKDPSVLTDYQRRAYQKYIDYLNQNIPEDSTDMLTKKASDSLLTASRNLLDNVKKTTEKKKASLSAEENKLLRTELLVSEQLRKILNIIEREIIANTTKNNAKKEAALKKTNEVVMIAAILGLVLTVFFLILILSDFSKTQSYKTKLEIANAKTELLLKNREQLLSTVSHDLKTPLSTIIGYSELLGNSGLNQKQFYYTKNIKGSSEYISKLVQDLLDFTKIEAGKIVVEKVPFLLSEIIDNVTGSIRSVYQSKDIKLILDVDKSFELKVIGDPFRLQQILTNIIGNAYKFTEKGFISVQAKPDADKKNIVILIEDSGIGIKEKNLELIFEEFTQADDNIEKKYGGSGLGLTISKKMTEILGGALELESEFGKGSIFKVTIPLVFDREPNVISNNENKRERLTALVLDDDSNLLSLTAEILRQKGFMVMAFGNALNAIEAMKANDFDFIITDIQMPEMDGFSFLEKLKLTTGGRFKNQPVIAVTGNSDAGAERYRHAGFSTVVRKPFPPSLLLEAIDSVLDKCKNPISGNPSNEVQNNGKPYCLASLISFLPNSDEALKDVLRTFEITTTENLKQLSDTIAKGNLAKMKETAHRMGPMFRQIQANEIGKILENLELKVASAEEAKTETANLKSKIEQLFLIFKEDSII
jgi:signal transduction histidine kinase/CheY-like chemotaxis protein